MKIQSIDSWKFLRPQATGGSSFSNPEQWTQHLHTSWLTTNDREPTDPSWLKKADKNILVSPAASYANPLFVTKSLCDKISDNRWFAFSLFTVSLLHTSRLWMPYYSIT